MYFFWCLSLGLIAACNAQTVSLYVVKGWIDAGVSLSAAIGGTDGQGRTTYLVEDVGARTEDALIAFEGTATLLQGPSDAIFTYAGPSMSMAYSCVLTETLCMGTVTDQRLPEPTIDTVEVEFAMSGVPVGGASATDSGAQATSTPGISSSGSPGPSSQSAETSFSQSGAPSRSESSSAATPSSTEDADSESAASAKVPHALAFFASLAMFALYLQ